MKKLLQYSTLCFLLVFLGTILASQSMASQDGVLEKIKHANTPVDNNQIDSVFPVPKKRVVAKVQYQGGSFEVLARKPFIGRYDCSSCHNDTFVTARNALQLTHGNIILNHGKDDNTLTCSDCHHDENRNFLQDKRGQEIDFDHSYQLCGKCHFRQKKDWIGGAHGKRVTYWAGKRVIRNCATCHNPHSPRFEKRFPATYSEPLELKGSMK